MCVWMCDEVCKLLRTVEIHVERGSVCVCVCVCVWKGGCDTTL